MGLFLQTAIIPECEVWEVQEAVKNVEEWLDTLDWAQCSYRKSERGSMVLFNEDCCGYEELALALSENLSSPVLLLYIYDGDFWGYYFYEKGVEPDQFSPMPDYFEDCSPQERQRCAGNSALLARYFSVEQEGIKRYLRQWTPDMVIRYGEDEERAYPEDEFGQEDKPLPSLEELRRIGFPGRDDKRIRWDGFPEDFLRFCERGEGQIRAGEIKSVNLSVGDYPHKALYGNPER